MTAALARAAAAPVSPLAALLASEKATGRRSGARGARAGRARRRARRRRRWWTRWARAGAGARGGRRARSAQAPEAARRRPCWRRSPPGPHDGGAREADLLRALPAVVKRDPERRAEAVGSLRAALAPERSFEVRGRAVMALGDAGQRGRSGRAGGAARARRRAGAALPGDARARRADARGRASIRALPCAARWTIRDPRVRETAALALGQHGDTGAAPSLIAGAKQEPWPFVRRAELEALGHLCTPGTGDLMLRAVARDVDGNRACCRVSPPRRTAAVARLDYPESANFRRTAPSVVRRSSFRRKESPIPNSRFPVPDNGFVRRDLHLRRTRRLRRRNPVRPARPFHRRHRAWPGGTCVLRAASLPNRYSRAPHWRTTSRKPPSMASTLAT